MTTPARSPIAALLQRLKQSALNIVPRRSSRRLRGGWSSVAACQQLEQRCLLSGNGIGTPSLAVTKGIVSSSSQQATFDSTVGPASIRFEQPGSDSVFEGTLTSELLRTGTAATPIDANASNVSPGDVLRVAVVVENQSTTGSAFDVTLRDNLSGGVTYVSNSLRAFDGTGQVVTFTEQGSSTDGSGFFATGIEFNDATANDGSFATPDECGVLDVLNSNLAGQNIVIVTYDVIVQTTAGSSAIRTSSATIANYAATEQGSNLANGISDAVSIDVDQIDLDVTTTVSNPTPRANDLVTWIVTVSNDSANATTAATGVAVRHQIPAGYSVVSGSVSLPSGGTFDEVSGLWTIGNSIPAGQSVSLSLQTLVTQSVAETQEVVDLELETDFGFSTNPVDVEVIAGQQVSYSVTLRNDAEAATTAATNITVGRLLPAGLTFVQGTPSIGSFNSVAGVWDLSSLELQPGQSQNLNIVATVDAAAADSTMNLVAEVLTVDQTDVDSVVANNSTTEDDDATGTLTVLPAPANRTVTGRVFSDINNDGIDNSEAGVSGIRIQLTDSQGTIVGTATTDASGTYTMTTATSDALRLEFTGWAAQQSVTTTGVSTVGSLAFLDAGSTNVTANLAIYQPDIQADLVTTCFIYSGQSSLDETVEPAVIAFRKDGSVKTTLATMADVGATNGIALQPASGDIFVAAFHKRHSDIGPAGNSAIYRITPAGNVSTFVRLDDIFGANFAGAYSHNPSDWFTDTPAFSEVGKVSLGDLEVSDDGRFLYTVNLATRELLQIPIGVGNGVSPVDYAASDSRTIQRFLLLGDSATSPTNGGIPLQQLGVDPAVNIRPFALHAVGNTVYVGMMNTAQSTDNVGDLRGFVYAFDRTTQTFAATPAADFSLGPRSTSGGWEAWSDDWNEFPTFYDAVADNFTVGRPQPWLTGIEFDNDGHMIVGIRDRTGDQVGHMVGDPTGADSDDNGQQDRFFHDTRGDLLKLHRASPGRWEIEVGHVARDDSEFYVEDFPTFDTLAPTLHPEAAQGGLIQVPGWTDIVTTAIDPQTYWAGGVLTLDNATGSQTDQLDLYSGSSVPDLVTFGKNNGLGDLQYTHNLEIEIGDRIWNDVNRNGLQDAGEPGIADVDLQLFDISSPIAQLVGFTTTNAAGEYRFNESNVQYNDGGKTTGLRPLTRYEVRIADAEFRAGGTLDQFSATTHQAVTELLPGTTQAVSSTAEFDSNDDGTLDTARNRRIDVLSDLNLRADGVRVQVLDSSGGIATVDEDGSVIFRFSNGSTAGNFEYRILDERIDSDAQGFDTDGDGQTDSAFATLATSAAGHTNHSYDIGLVQNVVDLSITKSVNRQVAAEGSVLTYTVEITNSSGSDLVDATGVTITDTLPVGITLVAASVSTTQGTFANGIWSLNGSLRPGQTETLTYQATVNSATVGSSLSAEAEVRSVDQRDLDSSANNNDGDHSEDDEDDATIYVRALTSDTAFSHAQVVAADQRDFDSTPANDDANQSEDDEDRATLTISTNAVTSGVNLVVTKDNTNPRDLAAVGGTVEYLVTVTNSGSIDAANAVLTDNLPTEFTSSTWTATGSLRSVFTASGTGSLNETISIPAGGTITYRVQAVLNDSYVGTITNTASVSTPQTDVDLSDNSATDVTTVTQLTLTPENMPLPGEPFQLGARGMSHIALLPFIVGTQPGPGVINGINVDIADPEIFMIGFVCIDDRIIAVYDIPDLPGPQTYYFQTYESSPVPRLSNVIQYLSGGAQVLASNVETDTLNEGQTERIEVRLNEQPTETVRVQVQNDSPDRLTIDQPFLEFTPDNWQQPQTVKVQAVDDAVSQADVTAAIRIGVIDDNTQFGDSLEQSITFEVLDNDELTTPALNSAFETFASSDVAFDWTPVEGADSYEVWLAPTLDVQSPIFRGTVTDNRFEASQPVPIGKHAVWIRALADDGRTSGWSPAGRIDVVTSTTVEQHETTNSLRPRLSWDPIPGAATYELWINNRSTGESRVIHRRDLTETEYLPSDDFSFGTHLVWVRGINEFGITGKWSHSTSINIGSTLLNPQLNTFSRRPELEWSTVEGAASWEIYLRVKDRVIRQTDLTEGRFVPLEDLPEGTHRWWVRGFTETGNPGGWSEAGEITIGGRPTVFRPTTSSQPELRWTPVADAVRYEIYLITLEPRILVLNETRVTESSLPLPQDLAVGTYRFWVRAVSPTGELSWWSQPTTFELT